MERTQHNAIIAHDKHGETPTLLYAGIGARATPAPILAEMTKMARSLGQAGWHLTSGGAVGADSAFDEGAPAGQKTIYLPWRGYNGHAGQHCRILSPAELASCIDIASKMHPAWNRCSPTVRKLHARNVAILLGPSLDRPVNAVVCWTEAGAIIGGTGMALRIAAKYLIPVFNLSTVAPREALVRLLNIFQEAGQ